MGLNEKFFKSAAGGFVPTDHFNTVLYDGNGTTKSITGVGFQPDLIWVKNRLTSGENHLLSDVASGFGKALFSNLTNAQVGSDNTYFSQLPNGFSINTSNGNISGTNNYVAWNWKAGGAAVPNTNGTITSQVSANVDAGFSIVKYTGNGTNGATVGHGLSQAPELILTKGLSTTYNWSVVTSLLQNGYLELNTTSGFNSNSSRYITAGTTTNSLTNYVQFNQNNINHIAYCFHSVAGYSKIGSFVGNGSTVNVVTGFKPAFIMWKNTTQGSASYDYWFIVDNKTSPSNPVKKVLYPNSNDAEATTSYTIANFNSNGFDIVGSAGGRVFNNSGDTYIYMAISE